MPDTRGSYGAANDGAGAEAIAAGKKPLYDRWRCMDCPFTGSYAEAVAHEDDTRHALTWTDANGRQERG